MIWKAVSPRKLVSRREKAQVGPKLTPVAAKKAQVRLPRDLSVVVTPIRTQHATHKGRLTPLAGSSPVAGARAVADEAIPAVLAHSVVLAGVAVTLLRAHP